ETMQRAAYCIGALDFTLRSGGPEEAATDNVCLGWKEQRHASREACIQALQQHLRDSLALKRKRYADHLYMEMGQRVILQGGDAARMALSSTLIERKGSDDAQATKAGRIAASDTRWRYCAGQCGARERRCLVDCIGEENPTVAAILRCDLLPDEL